MVENAAMDAPHIVRFNWNAVMTDESVAHVVQIVASGTPSDIMVVQNVALEVPSVVRVTQKAVSHVLRVVRIG